MGLIYIEYVSRRPGVDMGDFRAGVTHGQEGWDTGYGEDQLVLNIGRTWRLGPEPEYLAVWYSPQANFDRIDAWDRIFRSDEVDPLERPFFRLRGLMSLAVIRHWSNRFMPAMDPIMPNSFASKQIWIPSAVSTPHGLRGILTLPSICW